MDSYEVSYFQNGERGDTRGGVYYCNMHGLDARYRLDANGIQIKWRQT